MGFTPGSPILPEFYPFYVLPGFHFTVPEGEGEGGHGCTGMLYGLIQKGGSEADRQRQRPR
jgi:hypothetical protein